MLAVFSWVLYNNIIKKNDIEVIKREGAKKAKFIFETKDRLLDELKEDNSYEQLKAQQNQDSLEL